MCGPSWRANAPADDLRTFARLLARAGRAGSISPQRAQPGVHSHLPALHRPEQGMTRLLPVLLLLLPAVAAGQARPPAADTARALQRKYDQVKDFTATFTHTYEGGVLKK